MVFDGSMSHMPFNASRDTLLVQLFAIGDSVSQLRAEIVELGGALIEAEQKRLSSKLAALEAQHAALIEVVHNTTSH
jgi:uncharacterized membrane protein YgcG